jgi:hypothetical protein
MVLLHCINDSIDILSTLSTSMHVNDTARVFSLLFKPPTKFGQGIVRLNWVWTHGAEQCCGSGIRCFLPPGSGIRIRDGAMVGSGSGSGIKHPGSATLGLKLHWRGGRAVTVEPAIRHRGCWIRAQCTESTKPLLRCRRGVGYTLKTPALCWNP